ncbi:zinc finger CCCH domain-containing protein 11A isoform X3 [Ambystoma mexicanum]|uniref:zinc finger CCCH domain-containing protein 11A isoform X3 n=1 Tax=Ambystoma mexicanum TaxID=8296 RepID=UPI0037E7A257
MAAMSSKGQDCYFFFYSSCAKGDSCAFRHCDAAIGNETVCTLWQEGRCFRQVCKFRHMEIDKKRSEIPCYWENQPSGCQKANCAFHHTRGRFVEGAFLPPNKIIVNRSESTEEEVKKSQLSTRLNTSPQLRGVIKVDNETIPSPTHPPVVINAADDDDGGLSNAGMRSLLQSKSKNLTECGSHLSSVVGPGLCNVPTPLQVLPEMEKNLRSAMRTVTLSSCPDEEARFRLTLAERFEKRKTPFTEDQPEAAIEVPVLKRSLAARLGRKIKSPNPSINESPQKGHALKSVKERLGFLSEHNSIETVNSAEPEVEIHIKTLDEIRLEKLGQRLELDALPKGDGALSTEDSGARAQSGIHIKSFMEVLAEKKLRKMEEDYRHRVEAEGSKPVPNTGEEPQNPSSRFNLRSGDGKVQLVEASGRRRSMERVRVKTLEEIKREKALRLRKGGESAKNGATEAEPTTRGRKLLLSVKRDGGKEEKLQVELSIPSAQVEPSVPSAPRVRGDVLKSSLDLRTSEPNARVLVKSFEEIMREKRQRKQQEVAMELLKKHNPLSVLEASIPGGKAPEEISEIPPTSTKEPGLTTKLQQLGTQRSSPGKPQQLALGNRKDTSPLRATQIAAVQHQQPVLVKPPHQGLQGSSQLNPEQLSSPVKKQKPSPAKPQQQSSPLGSLQQSFTGKSEHPTSLVKPQLSCSPVKLQQPTSLVKPQQPSSPGKARLQSSLLVNTLQPSSPVRPAHPSSPSEAQQPPQAETLQFLPNDLTPMRQPETLETSPQETDTLPPEDEASSAADMPVDEVATESKGKPKASVKPTLGRKRAPAKGPQKRKGAKSKPTAVAAVKPLSPTPNLDEPPAKKAALTTVDMSLTEEAESIRTELDISRDSMMSTEALQDMPAPASERASPATSPASVKARRSSTSAPKTPLPAEDEFERLMFEFSGDHLEEEAEIDLDAGKDEDDLLLELSEMIDS